jgi:hypothetical protein
MTRQKSTDPKIIRFWHPSKGGWYHARLVKRGRKWATVQPLGANQTRKRVPVDSVRESLFVC